MNKNIVGTIEKENEFKELKTDSIHLKDMGKKIASTITCHVGGVDIQHCSLIVEVTESDSEIKSSD